LPATLFVREESAQVYFHLPTVRVTFVGAEKIHIVGVVAEVVGIDDVAVRKEHGRNLFHRLASLLDVYGVLVRQVLADPFLWTEVADTEPDRELENDDRVGAEAAQDSRHRGVESGEYCRNTDDGAGPDDAAD